MTDLTDPTIAWLDCETTALHRRRRAWETAAIVRPPGQPDTEHQWMVDVRDLDLSYADPVSLRIGGFWDRHPQARWVEESGGKVRLTPEATYQVRPVEGVVSEREMLAAVADLTAGKAVITGSNPDFDRETLGPRMEWYGITPGWHYHPEDVPSMARGWLRAQGLAAPRKSDEIVRACGLDLGWYDRHTALGDCRLFRDLHRLVSQPPKRPPGGFWPVGGRPAGRWRTCAGCGDDIWPNELLYAADASGDTSDTAGVRCAVCETQAAVAW